MLKNKVCVRTNKITNFFKNCNYFVECMPLNSLYANASAWVQPSSLVYKALIWALLANKDKFPRRTSLTN